MEVPQHTMPPKYKEAITSLATNKLYKACFKHVLPRYTPQEGVGLYAKDTVAKE